MNAVMVLFFGILGFVLIGKAEREHLSEVQIHSKADVMASSAILYRNAAKCFISANPGHTGAVAWSQINATPGCVPLGMQNPSSINATVSSGRLYVYSTKAVSPETLSKITEKMHNSPIVAKKMNGLAISVAGTLGRLTAPSVIPNDAMIIVGN